MTTLTTQDRTHAEKDGSFTIDCRLKPLTKDQIKAIWRECPVSFTLTPKTIEFVRLIEQAHGIK